MKTRLVTALVSTVLLTLSLPAADLGDAAAPLEIADWVKGDAVDLAAAKGKNVVVIEFWATWCGPCKVSIPHLTEIQKKYEQRGVIVVGVTDEDRSKVKPFVDEQGAQMNYTVAIDREGKTAAGYMQRYGQNGIPHAFVVDKDGRVAWHGHPMSGLERVLDQLASNTFDLAVERKRNAGMKKIQEFFEMALKGENDESLDKIAVQIAALDKEVGGINPEEKLDLADIRRSARFQNIMEEYKRAIVSGRSDADLEKLQAKAKPLAPKDFDFTEFTGRFQAQRTFQEYYRAVTGRGDASKADELAKKLEASPGSNPEVLNEMAWTILTDEKIKTRNLPLAKKLAKTAVDLSDGQNCSILDTYARALFESGDVEEAVKLQSKAIAICEDKDEKTQFEENLKRYQAKAKTAKK